MSRIIKMKKLIAIMLAAVLVLALTCVPAFAFEVDFPDESELTGEDGEELDEDTDGSDEDLDEDEDEDSTDDLDEGTDEDSTEDLDEDEDGDSDEDLDEDSDESDGEDEEDDSEDENLADELNGEVSGDPAANEEIVLHGIGSITLSMTDGEINATDGEWTLYYVASTAKGATGYIYVFTEDFADCGVSLDDVSESSLAENLVAWVNQNQIAGVSQTVGEDGLIEFDDLPTGLYLLIQTGASTDFEVANPFVISVPMIIDGEYVLDVNAAPKVDITYVEPPSIPVPTPEVKTSDTANLFIVPLTLAATLALIVASRRMREWKRC